MDYALSSGGGNIAASASPTTVETVQISNGVESCGNGNNGEPRGTTAYNNNCNAIDVNTQPGAMNTGARAPPREPPLAARSVPLLRVCAADEAPTPPLPSQGNGARRLGAEAATTRTTHKSSTKRIAERRPFRSSSRPSRSSMCATPLAARTAARRVGRAQRQGAPWPPREGVPPTTHPPPPPHPHPPPPPRPPCAPVRR